MPDGPFDPVMLLGLLKEDKYSTMSKQKMIELLKICTVSKHDDMVISVTPDMEHTPNNTVGLGLEERQVILKTKMKQLNSN